MDDDAGRLQIFLTSGWDGFVAASNWSISFVRLCSNISVAGCAGRVIARMSRLVVLHVRD
jgi:hypothetical protein